MSKIKKLDIEYADGVRQVAHVSPGVIHCEMFRSGAVINAGEMSPEDFRGELGMDLIASCQKPTRDEVLAAFGEALEMAKAEPTEETDEMIDAENRAMRLAEAFGWNYAADEKLAEYCLKATNTERLEADRDAFKKWSEPKPDLSVVSGSGIMMMSPENTMIKVVAGLNRRGVMAFYEYPGYVDVPLDKQGVDDSRWSLAFGDGGATWGGSIVESETGVQEADEYCLETGLSVVEVKDEPQIVEAIMAWLTKIEGMGVYTRRACQWFVISPDNLPFNQEGFKSEEEAGGALFEFCERYRQQGYYKTDAGERIPFMLIASRCAIRTGVEGVI